MSSCKRQRPSTESPTDSLLHHLQSLGASFPKLSFRQMPNSGVTAFAKMNIEVGEVVASIPKTCVLTTEKINQSPLGMSLSHHFQTTPADSSSFGTFVMSNEFLLCLYLVAAKRDTSNPFHTYASSLSLTPPDPTNWSTDLQSYLKGTVASATRTALDELETWHVFCTCSDNNLTVSPFNTVKPTLQELCWARGHVVSRRFPETITPLLPSSTADLNKISTHAYSMLPGLDLLNHSPDVEMKWEVDSVGTIRFVAMTSIKKDEECLNNYGNKSNTQLLFMHGFALENNMHDVVELSLKAKDPTTGVVSVLWQDQLDGNETTVPLSMLSNFVDEDEDISAEVIEYVLEWVQHHLEPYTMREEEEEVMLLTVCDDEKEKDKKKDNFRLRCVALHHSSQRRILRHMLSLLEDLLRNTHENKT